MGTERDLGSLPGCKPPREALDATRVALRRREGGLGAAGARPDARKRRAAGKGCLLHGGLGHPRGEHGGGLSGLSHAGQVEHRVLASDTARGGTRHAAFALHRRWIFGAAGRHGGGLSLDRGDRAKASRIPLATPLGLVNKRKSPAKYPRTPYSRLDRIGKPSDRCTSLDLTLTVSQAH